MYAHSFSLAPQWKRTKIWNVEQSVILAFGIILFIAAYICLKYTGSLKLSFLRFLDNNRLFIETSPGHAYFYSNLKNVMIHREKFNVEEGSFILK